MSKKKNIQELYDKINNRHRFPSAVDKTFMISYVVVLTLFVLYILIFRPI